MKKKSKTFSPVYLITFLLLAILTSCSQIPEQAINRDNFDFSVKPGDDFYKYVNGRWIDNIEIPDDKVSYGVFDILRENRDKNVKELLDKVSNISNAEKGSVTQKISDFYYTGMNEAEIEKDGIKYLIPEFELINDLSTKEELMDLVARFHTYGLDPMFVGGVEQDLANSSVYKFYLMQAGTGLPDVEYYTKDDERSIEIREEYVKHIAKMLEILGDQADKALLNSKMVMAIETRMAEKAKTLLEMRDIPGLYNKMNLNQLQELCPNFNWEKYFENISEKDFGDIIVGMPLFFSELSILLDEIPLSAWKTYMRWNLINRSSEYLSSDFVNQDYMFYSEFLSGSKQIRDRWERVVETTNAALGELLGKLYVEEHFPPESKEKMNELVKNLKASMKIRIKKLEWMTETTKEASLAKLEKMKVRIGYPDKWEDYSKLEIKRDAYINNVRRTNFFAYYKNLDKFGKPVDMELWGMTPQTVNAGYNPLKNDMTFPAGILQPPFFNPGVDDAVNFGAIGVVIGHEMTHGFDDMGRRFDKDGNMTDWWTKEDEEMFNIRTQLLVDQYDNFIAIDDVHVNGKLTLGENIADFGGLSISLAAYQMSLDEGSIHETIDGFTDIQRFFLSYAQIWRGKIRDKALLRKVQEDVHPYGKFRTNGAPFNVPEFYDAFEIFPENKLYRTIEQRPIIW